MDDMLAEFTEQEEMGTIVVDTEYKPEEETYASKTNQYYRKLGFFELMSAVYFTLNSGYICGIEYLKYKVGWKSKTNMIIDIAKRLASINMMYVKIFQSFATNRTLLNDELNQFFSKYTDNVEYSSDEYDVEELRHLERVSTHHYPFKQLRISNNYKPIQTGLMSLIFKGTFVDPNADPDPENTDGHPIVIKYLRKNISQNFNSSMNNLVLFAKLTTYIPYLRTLHIESLILQNVVCLKDQICFRKEVSNIKEYYNIWKDCDYVKIPVPYPDFTENVDPNIIIMDFIQGIKLSEIDADDNDEFGKLLASFNAKAAFSHSLFHGDLHPGNILFIKEIENDHNTDTINNVNKLSDKIKYKIGILDFGIIGHLTREDQELLFCVTKLLYQKKYRRMIEFILSDMSEPLDDETVSGNKPKKPTQEEYAMMQNELHKIILSYATPEIKLLGVAEMYHVNFVLNNYGLTFKRTLYKLFITLAIMDSITTQLGSEISYMQHMTDIVVDLFAIDIGDLNDD